MTNFHILASLAGFNFDELDYHVKRKCELFMQLVIDECIFALTDQLDHPESLDKEIYNKAVEKVKAHFTITNKRKVVINVCYGGFGLSDKGVEILAKQKGKDTINEYELARDDPLLVELVEKYDQESWGPHSELKVIEIPNHINWHIAEYDGKEWVAENHNTWT